LIKLSGGEYIAMERLETTYKSCNLVSNICVYGHENARQPMAIIIPHEAQLRQFLQAQAPEGVNPHASLEELCHNEAVRNLVLNACNTAGKKTGFKPLEMLETVVLTSEEWTAESGLVTAAQKLQRKKILETFKDQVKVC
jgi:long-chain acyl-CoA synthetase